MGRFIAARGTGVQELLNGIVFVLSNSIVVYPVEDENRYTDHYGSVLPDAVLMRDGSTAYDLAMTVHTDIANSMLYAVDAKTKMRLPKDYVLKNNDVLRIVTAARHK
jgi:ribosome-binding ATPase YchF (GTP1/OBG family)